MKNKKTIVDGKALKNNDEIINEMYNKISNIILNNKNKIVYQINNTLVETYFLIGKVIVENEQNGNIRAEYGKEIIISLSRKLTNRFGSGFSRTGLQNMRLFYDKYKNCQPLAGNLSWSHYCELLSIENDDERSFYEKGVLIIALLYCFYLRIILHPLLFQRILDSIVLVYHNSYNYNRP